MFIIKSLLQDSTSSQNPKPEAKEYPKSHEPSTSSTDMNIFGVAPETVSQNGPHMAMAQEPVAKPVIQPQTAPSTVHSTLAQETKKELPGFPTLQPAIVTKVNIGDAQPLGQNYTGSSIIHFGTPTGSIETVPGFEPAFKATVNFGADWLSFDPDNKHARIDLRGVAKDEEGHAIDFRYTGILTLDEKVMLIFTQNPAMKTIPFGYTTGHHKFLTANPRLKELEHCTFVSNSRITVTETGLTVETRQSKVIPSTIMDFPSTVFE